MTLGDHCTIERRDGRLVISVPEEQMLDYFLRSDPDFPLVENRPAFFSFLAAHLLQTEARPHEEIYTTALEEIFRRTAMKYEEQGAS